MSLLQLRLHPPARQETPAPPAQTQTPSPAPRNPEPETAKGPPPAKAKGKSRILLADDSPHAQRMGERILREEGYEVVSVIDGDAALKRIAEVDPDLVIVDVFLPGKNGFEVCRYLKTAPPHKHVRVVMTAGLLEVFDEDEAGRAGADAIIRKPFEASVVLETIAPMIADAKAARGRPTPAAEAPATRPVVVIEPVTGLDEEEEAESESPAIEVAASPAIAERPGAVAAPAEIDPELVRAAVTVALDAAMPSLVDEITERVLAALRVNQ